MVSKHVDNKTLELFPESIEVGKMDDVDNSMFDNGQKIINRNTRFDYLRDKDVMPLDQHQVNTKLKKL